MNRRDFLKFAGLGGTALYVPATFTLDALLQRSWAASPDYDAAEVSVTAPLPQVINIFLYGGPSELSGNLTQIEDIAAASQSSYANNIRGILATTADDPEDGQITPRGFWRDAGGQAMEFLVNRGYMTVYRTMVKRVNDSRSHRESIFQAQKGTTDVEGRPGIGTVLAQLLSRNAGQYLAALGKGSLGELILPFVSLEGETTFFAPDPGAELDLGLRYQTLGTDLENPFARRMEPIFDQLVEAVNGTQGRFSRVKLALEARAQLAAQIGDIGARFEAPLVFSQAAIDPEDLAEDFQDNGDGTVTLQYPNNRFAEQIRAAVTLAVENPDTLFISAGNVGLGGWDDHNNGCDRYAERMQDLFETLRVACKHIRYADGTTPGGVARSTGNILINVYGEFGRRCNLNGSCGWDHGNLQNLFTLMGAAVRPAGALGKVVGRTRRSGTPGTNNQVQVPAPDSYEFEPAAVAATIYRAFGVLNPEVLTADPVLNPAGSGPIDQTVAGEPPLFSA
ncbi:MAG: hypothetical protein KatS3mg121_1401 [Gammaproteobacteria bacterium]|nr:MAG: hypothetical protein KatS3mg121_1401 [Gammaproteobacteria bacterium]